MRFQRENSIKKMLNEIRGFGGRYLVNDLFSPIQHQVMLGTAIVFFLDVSDYMLPIFAAVFIIFHNENISQYSSNAVLQYTFYCTN